MAHFGYRDGFAQPTIDGGLPPLLAGRVAEGARRASSCSDTPANTRTSPIRSRSRPRNWGNNGSFVAFRILAQDCHGFEQFLVDAARQTSLDPETGRGQAVRALA